jgi:hypothetical protein
MKKNCNGAINRDICSGEKPLDELVVYRVTPVSPIFGIDRGFPIGRYYIEKFLEANCKDIKGRCLEMGGAFYIK